MEGRIGCTFTLEGLLDPSQLAEAAMQILLRCSTGVRRQIVNLYKPEILRRECYYVLWLCGAIERHAANESTNS